MHIFVGSTNPVKVNAIKRASEQLAPTLVKGISVASGVAEQPMSDAETRLGAENRAKAALREGCRGEGFGASQDALADSQHLSPCLGIGLEGGVFEEAGRMWSTVWVAVAEQSGAVYAANGMRFVVPEIIADRIRAGGEMGPVMSDLFQEDNVKHKQGMIGIITKNYVDRTGAYADIAKVALGLWYGRNWEAELTVAS